MGAKCMSKNKDREVSCNGCGMHLLCDCEDDEHFCPNCEDYADGNRVVGGKKGRKINSMLNEARFYNNVAEDNLEAIKICNQILELDHGNRDAMLIKAGALNNSDRFAETAELIIQIKDKWPDHWEAYYLYGLNKFNENEEEAMREFEKSIELKENFDNLISAAQLAYFMRRPVYKEYLEKAKKLDQKRFDNYMKNYWENKLI